MVVVIVTTITVIPVELEAGRNVVCLHHQTHTLMTVTIAVVILAVVVVAGTTLAPGVALVLVRLNGVGMRMTMGRVSPHHPVVQPFSAEKDDMRGR